MHTSCSNKKPDNFSAFERKISYVALKPDHFAPYGSLTVSLKELTSSVSRNRDTLNSKIR